MKIRSFYLKVSGLLMLTALVGSAFAQDGRVVISGTVLDSLEQPLTGASILLMQAEDSLMAAFAIADGKGDFRLEAKEPRDYFLQVTFVGYGTFRRELTIEEGQGDLALGRIILDPEGYELDEVTVKGSFIPIIIKKDTVEYNAAAFPTPEGAVVEDLLRRLPGVEVDQDGTIRAHGEKVENVMVDGKPFFEDDPKIASQNIPADLVEKVQVFDRKSDFAEFTGIDDGREEKSINLQIKEGQNRGLFGTVDAGYGPEDRYKGSANLNRFTDDVQLSLLANANNINEQPFSFEEYLQFVGGFEELMNGGSVDMGLLPSNLMDNAGITDSYSGGLNWNYDFNSNTSLRTNYFMNDSDNFTCSDSYTEQALPQSFFTTSGSGESATQLRNHRLRAELKHQFDKTQDIRIKGSGSLFENTSSVLGNTQSLSGAQLANQATRENASHLDGWTWRSELSYRKKLAKAGRFLTLEGNFDGRSSDSRSDVETVNTRYPEPAHALTDSLRQKQVVDANGWTAEGRLNYVEPLGKTNYLKLGLHTNWVDNYREKQFSDWDGNGTFRINDQLSNAFDRELNQHTFETALKAIRQKWNASLGLDLQQTRLISRPLDGGTTLRSAFYNLLPNARFQYDFHGSSGLELDYRTRIQAPSAEQLQPVVDNSDPLNIYIGNPALKPERISSVWLRYNNFSQFYLRSTFLGLSVELLEDRIINASTIDEELVRTTRPVNSRSEWRVTGYYDYLTPLTGIDLKVGLNGSVSYQQNNFQVNEVLDLSRIWELDQTVRLENKDKETWDWTVGYTYRRTRTSFDQNDALGLPFSDYTFFTRTYWYAEGDWTLYANWRYQRFSEARDRSGRDFLYLDAGIQKSFFKRQFTVYLRGSNLFDQEVSFRRQSFGNQLAESMRNRFGRLVRLGVVYKVRSFGK